MKRQRSSSLAFGLLGLCLLCGFGQSSHRGRSDITMVVEKHSFLSSLLCHVSSSRTRHFSEVLEDLKRTGDGNERCGCHLSFSCPGFPNSHPQGWLPQHADIQYVLICLWTRQMIVCSKKHFLELKKKKAQFSVTR